MFCQRDHTADLALEVEAASLPELFAEALRGLTDCVTDVAGIEPRHRRRLKASAAALDLLLAAFLDEALYRFEAGGELYSGARVALRRGAAGHELAAEVLGERLDPERHPVKTAIKGVTLHGLAVERRAEGWRARVVLDI